MTYKQLETIREARLWFSHILIPAAGLTLAFPEIRQRIADKAIEVKERIQRKGS